MFGVGVQEVVVILGVALVVIGPKKLPQVARTLGRAMAEFRRAASDLRQSFESEYNHAVIEQKEKENQTQMANNAESEKDASLSSNASNASNEEPPSSNSNQESPSLKEKQIPNG